MVEFSRIIKKLCLDIYLTASPAREKLLQARRIEVELDDWMDKRCTQNQPLGRIMPLKSVRRWKYTMKQQLILKIRKSSSNAMPPQCTNF